jgi:tRNA-Thr(GGU) m(6)t(6)A37 methyltransferase TsaA
MQAELLMEGLDQFSHVWVVWVFHHNTNAIKTALSRCDQEKPQAVRPYFKAKVRPPRLNGRKVGVFATRSPHRPNPIGLSLAKIESIDGCKLWLRGIDIVDSTPILDIKPYVPCYDSLPDAQCASWIDSDAGVFAAVNFSLEAEEMIERFAEDSQFYSSSNEIKTVLREVLRIDIRSLNQRNVRGNDNRRVAEGSTSYNVRVDNFIAEYVVDERRVVEVFAFRVDQKDRDRRLGSPAVPLPSVCSAEEHE